MLQILKQDAKDNYLCEIKSLGLSAEAAHVSEAVDGANVIGWAIYELGDDVLIIHKITPTEDLVLFDGIIRSVLFLAQQKGVNKAVVCGNAIEAAQRLKLLSDGKNTIEPISDVFGGCKHCKSNKE